MHGGKMTTFCGSPCYTAPECLKGTSYDGVQADLWSMGVILYEMVTGRHPWNIANFPLMVKQITTGQYSVPSSVTQMCDSMIKGLMKVRPGDRLSTDEIFRHPWMRLVPSKLRCSMTLSLPPLLPEPFHVIVTSAGRRNPSPSVLKSPFDLLPGTEEAGAREGARASTPRRIRRAFSSSMRNSADLARGSPRPTRLIPLPRKRP
jgi:serine/threonine protein kinase